MVYLFLCLNRDIDFVELGEKLLPQHPGVQSTKQDGWGVGGVGVGAVFAAGIPLFFPSRMVGTPMGPQQDPSGGPQRGLHGDPSGTPEAAIAVAAVAVAVAVAVIVHY